MNVRIAIFVLAGMFVIVQLELLMLLQLHKANLDTWESQTEFNASVIDVCSYVAGH